MEWSIRNDRVVVLRVDASETDGLPAAVRSRSSSGLKAGLDCLAASRDPLRDG